MCPCLFLVNELACGVACCYLGAHSLLLITYQQNLLLFLRALLCLTLSYTLFPYRELCNSVLWPACPPGQNLWILLCRKSCSWFSCLLLLVWFPEGVLGGVVASGLLGVRLFLSSWMIQTRVLSLLCLDRASTQEPGQRSKILEACSSQGDAEALLTGELGGREADLPGHPLSSQAGLRGGRVIVEVP